MDKNNIESENFRGILMNDSISNKDAPKKEGKNKKC